MRKRILTFGWIVMIQLGACQKKTILPAALEKCGEVTAKTEFKGKYILFIDGIGFELPQADWEGYTIGDRTCSTQSSNR